MPDITLFRRADLVAAAQADLIESLDVMLPTDLTADMAVDVQALGQVDGRAFGVPFALDVQHLAFAANVTDPPGWSFDDVLAAQFSFVFPMGRTTGISDVLLAQVIAAGAVEDEFGALVVDEAALISVFSFYEAALAAGIITPDVLEYNDATNYETALANREINAGVISSSQYLRLDAQTVDLTVGVIPTSTGGAVTVLDGWSWVVVASSAEQQVLASRFIEWMLDIERQEAYTSAIGMIPSQRAALRRWENLDYAEFVDMLLSNAALPITGSAGAPTGRLLQSALAAVISGQMSAEAAARDVVSQLGG
jgi:ABC-type glycerol-3-phosphate transport system substrate-binding protein